MPAGATPFDMPGVDFAHHGADCSFETILRRYELDDPVLWQIVHILRGLSMVCDEAKTLEITGPMFDGAYEFCRLAVLTGREPA